MSSIVCAPSSFEVAGRRWEQRLAGACVCIVALVPWMLQMSIVMQAAVSVLSVFLVVYGFHVARWLPAGPRIVRVIQTSSGEWHLYRADGQRIEAMLLPRTRRFRHWQWLVFSSGHVLLLGPSDLDDDSLRRMRVLLRRQGVERETLGESVA